MGLARDAREGGVAGNALDPEQCFDALHRIAAAEELGPVVCVAAAGEPALVDEALERPAVLDEARSARTAVAVSDDDRGFDVVRLEVRAMVAKELEIEESKLNDEARFDELGIDSIVLIGVVAHIE